MGKVIFLDIDGVVTSVRTGWFNMDIYTVNFLRWVCKQAEVKIVISSTWRYNHGKEFWKSIFGEYLHDDFKTPDLKREQVYSDAKRGDEIQAWRAAHPEVNKYLILDDDSDMLDIQQDSFIQTDSLNGMLSEHMMRVKEYWGILEFPKDEKKLFQHENMFAERRTTPKRLINFLTSDTSK